MSIFFYNINYLWCQYIAILIKKYKINHSFDLWTQELNGQIRYILLEASFSFHSSFLIRIMFVLNTLNYLNRNGDNLLDTCLRVSLDGLDFDGLRHCSWWIHRPKEYHIIGEWLVLNLGCHYCSHLSLATWQGKPYQFDRHKKLILM